MATYTIRGTTHNVIYTYKTVDGKSKQQWESYSSKLEAIQRKAYIDYLQAQNRASDIAHEAAEYRRKKAIEKTTQKIAAENAAVVVPPSVEAEDNMSKTYREFMERFLPIADLCKETELLAQDLRQLSSKSGNTHLPLLW